MKSSFKTVMTSWQQDECSNDIAVTDRSTSRGRVSTIYQTANDGNTFIIISYFPAHHYPATSSFMNNYFGSIHFFKNQITFEYMRLQRLDLYLCPMTIMNQCSVWFSFSLLYYYCVKVTFSIHAHQIFIKIKNSISTPSKKNCWTPRQVWVNLSSNYGSMTINVKRIMIPSG